MENEMDESFVDMSKLTIEQRKVESVPPMKTGGGALSYLTIEMIEQLSKLEMGDVLELEISGRSEFNEKQKKIIRTRYLSAVWSAGKRIPGRSFKKNTRNGNIYVTRVE